MTQNNECFVAVAKASECNISEVGKPYIFLNSSFGFVDILMGMDMDKVYISANGMRSKKIVEPTKENLKKYLDISV